MTNTKKMLAGLAIATCTALAAPAQQATSIMADPDLADPDLITFSEDSSTYKIGAKYVRREYDRRHTALENRYDYDDGRIENWEDGNYRGSADGFRLAVSKDDEGEFFIQYLFNDDYDYNWTSPQSHHLVYSEGIELQTGWRQTAEAWEDGRWGWTVAYYRSDSDKDMHTREGRDVRIAEDRNITWNMVQAGYFGDWNPLSEYVDFFGEAGLRFGEAEGIARRGNDPSWKNGDITEGYIDDSSLAYGAYFRIGAGVNFKGIFVDAAYYMSWMYSFDETDSGTVVFPDNNDALFIQNDRAFEFRVGYTYQF